MTVTLEIVPYRSISGFYIRARWPDGSSVHIEDSVTDSPAFDTEARAQAWIDCDAATWLENWSPRTASLDVGRRRRSAEQLTEAT